jgi:signal transduction histidine kinase
MRLPRPQLRAALRPPGRTVRSRLTWLYGFLFLATGAALLAVTAFLWGHATARTPVTFSNVPPKILHIAGLPTQGAGIVAVPGGGAVKSGSFTVTGGAAPAPGPPVEVPAGGAMSRRAASAGGGSPNGQAGEVRAAGQARAVVTQLKVLANQQHTSDLHDLLLYSGLALALMAIASIVLGWWMAGRVLRPLRTITSTARDISAHNLHERLEMDGPDDELKELGDTFDQLLSRLERSFQSQRQFVANASHELRTPLAIMRANLDVALAKPEPAPPQTVRLAARLREELDQVDRLLDSFLALARAQAGPTDGDCPEPLDHLVASALEDHSAAIAEQHLSVSDEGTAEARVTGNGPLLARMVDNLVDNAVRHNEPFGWIRITTEVDGPVARLMVENGGLRLDEVAVAALGRPFRRLGPERTGYGGSGLGLSIVAAIAEAHGGRLVLHAAEGGGLRAVVELPQVDALAPDPVPA